MVALTSLLHVLPLLLATAQGQLAGRVGPLTTAAEKNATRTCNVLDYGAVADNATDVGQPIIDAFADCGSGGVIYIPPGDYLQATWVHLTNGSAFAIQLDGIIYRGAAPSSQSYMFEISSSSDFEVFSSTSRGAIQGSGYLYHQSGNFVGPRLLHVSGGSDWAVHDLALVDSPMFHFVIQGATNGEVYNMAIRGGDHGGLDGIDVSGTNIWIHDVMVTNKDECVTVKTGSKNILVESIYCNSSGGCAMGSLGAGTNVSDVTYRNVYTWSSNQMFMIKSNGGSGTVSNVLFENFMGHGNAYSLDFDTAWSSMSTIEGDGIAYSNITFRNWKGTEVDGEDRPLIKVKCPALTPCTDLTIEEFALWNEEGHYALHVCEHSYGSGYCLSNATVPVTGTAGGYTTTQYINTPPAGYSATTMAEDLATAFGTSASIPIPTIPTSFYPGLTPYSPLAGASAFPSSSSFPSSSAYPSSSAHPSSSALPSYRRNATASVRPSTPPRSSTPAYQSPTSSSLVSLSSEPPSACYFATSSPDVTVAPSASSSMSTASASSAYDSHTEQRVPPRPHDLDGQHLQFHQHHGGRHPYH